MVGLNPEVAHETMSGLSFYQGVAQALWQDKLFHIDLNDQRIGRFDQDFRFGSEGIKDHFFLVRLLENSGYSGVKHFDAHAYRTEDTEGVWDFARGCIRNYLALAAKAREFDQDPRVAAAMSYTGVAQLAEPTVGPYSAARRSRADGRDLRRRGPRTTRVRHRDARPARRRPHPGNRLIPWDSTAPLHLNKTSQDRLRGRDSTACPRESIGAVAGLAAASLLVAACSSSSTTEESAAALLRIVRCAVASEAASEMASEVAAAGGKACVILPDAASSARWETADRPFLEEAFTAAGVEYDIQNANGDKAKFATIADGMLASGCGVLAIVNLDSETGCGRHRQGHRCRRARSSTTTASRSAAAPSTTCPSTTWLSAPPSARVSSSA